MNVIDFYASGLKVFDEDVLREFDFIDDVKKETAILNFFFVDKFGLLEITCDTQAITNLSVLQTLRRKEIFLNAIYESLTKKFDPFVLSKMKETVKKDGNNEDKITFNSKDKRDVKETAGISTTLSSRVYDDDTIEDTAKTTPEGTDTTSDILMKSGYDTTTHDIDETEKRDKEGFDNIDYRKVLEDLYRSKEINLYDIILDEVCDVICIPIYHFE